jgi:hypothetical protein
MFPFSDEGMAGTSFECLKMQNKNYDSDSPEITREDWKWELYAANQIHKYQCVRLI